jgi:azurin
VSGLSHFTKETTILVQTAQFLRGLMQSRKQLNRRAILKWLGFLAGVGFTAGAITGCGDSAEQDAVSLEIACDGNNLAFDKTTLTAAPGQLVELSFHNVSTTFQHNWVLVAGGEEVGAQVNQVATAAGPNSDYMPGDTTQILAYTKLLSRGESDTITFMTPTTSGEYVYLCTFPGHYLAGMKGIFVVTA